MRPARNAIPPCLPRFNNLAALILGVTLAFFGPVFGPILECQTAHAQEIRTQDTVYLKNGSKLIGQIISDEGADPVVMQLENGIKTPVPRGQIDRIVPRQDARTAYTDAASKLAADDAKAHLDLAIWCLDHEIFKEARTELDKVLKITPKLKEAYITGVQLELEATERAANSTERELAQDRLMALVSRAESEDCWSAVTGCARAELLSGLNLNGAARDEFKRVIQALESAAELSKVDESCLRRALLGLGQMRLRLGEPEQAIESLDSLLSRDESNFLGALTRGRARARIDDHEGAVADFDRAAVAEPAAAEVYAERAVSRAELGDFVLAARDLTKALELGGGDRRAILTQLGLCLLRQGKLKSAVNRFKETRGEEPYTPAELGLALVELQRGAPEKALVLLDKVRALTPRNAGVEGIRARAMLTLGSYADAEKALQNAMQLGFAAPEGLRGLSYSAAERGDTERAILWLRYLTDSPGLHKADDLYRLGRLYLKEKKIDEARAAFEAAVALDSKHAHAHNGLGFLAYESADFEVALRHFEAAKASDPTNIYAARALKNISESRTRKVWIDTFQREGPSVANRWQSNVGFGVIVELRNKAVIFEGTQSNTSFGKTQLVRRIDDGEFVRFEATIDTSQARESRVGVRIQLGNSEVFLFRSEDGKKIIAAHRIGGQKDPTLLQCGNWPGDSDPRTLAIEIEDANTGRVSFHLDGEQLSFPLGEGIASSIDLSAFRRPRNVDCIIYGQAELAAAWRLSLQKVRVFVKREGGAGAPGTPGNY